jgi:hypothetical protein
MILARALNGIDHSLPPGRERDDLVSVLSELQSLRKNHKGMNDQRPEDFAGVNGVLRRYPWVVELVAIGREGPLFADFPAPDSSDFTSLHMRMVVKLARLQLLGQLRQCVHCEAWFFASRNPKARYCSTACRQAEHRSKPGYKEKNRDYQSRYYRDVLSPVTGRWKAKKATRRRA